MHLKWNNKVEWFYFWQSITYIMRTHIDFFTSTPILADKKTFAGMTISDYLCVFNDEDNKFLEICNLSDEYDYWSIPTLLATIAGDMSYWGDFRKVSSVNELQTLIEDTIYKYTEDDLNKYIGLDDFDEYLTLLFITGDEIRRDKVKNNNLSFFNDFDVSSTEGEEF